MMAVRAGLSAPAKPALSAASTNTGHSSGLPPRLFRASPTLHSAMAIWVTTSMRRRSTASATEPPSSEPTSAGPSCARLTRPTSSDEPVIT
jgi:hypothetical protein